MSGNTIGKVFQLTTFGESHSPAIGGIIEGCPAGLFLDYNFVRKELDRRKPGYFGSTPRKETDEFEFLSGIENGSTTGAPIKFIIKNLEYKPSDYQDISGVFRPSHADYTYFLKYGKTEAGGGRASGRETVARVVGGAVAKLLLQKPGIEIRGDIETIGGEPYDPVKTAGLVQVALNSGDTLGGTVTCRISGVPAGLGEPVFDKLQADLAKAMLSIGSAKAFEYGIGFEAASMKGSAYNDQMTVKDGKIIFLTNHDGGIQGGISNGQEIYFRVGFKPVPSVKLPQSSVNQEGEQVEIRISGRHDTCHVPRLVVVVEAMAALVLADHLLRNA
jgi:chorismate synthase